MQGRDKPGCLLEKTVSRGVRRGVSILAIVDFHVLYVLGIIIRMVGGKECRVAMTRKVLRVSARDEC